MTLARSVLLLALFPALLAAQPAPPAPPPPPPPAAPAPPPPPGPGAMPLPTPVPPTAARIRARLLHQLSQARTAITACADQLPAKATRPPVIRLLLSEHAGQQQLRIAGDTIKPARARPSFESCVQKAVAAEFQVGTPSDPGSYNSGPVTVNLPGNLPGSLPAKGDPLGCMADADCELVCPTAGNCCAGMCGACSNALNHAGAVAARALAKTACKPACAVGCAMKREQSRAVCVDHRCTGKVSSGGIDSL